MPGIRNLRRIQIGQEATAGTLVKTSTLWRGTGTIQDDTLVVNPSEDIGVIMDVDRVYIPSQGGTLTLDAVPATFEQLPYILTAGIKALVTGVADGGGTGKIYTYPFPTVQPKPTVTTFSVQAGDDQQMEEATYGFVESLKLSGKVNAAIEMSAVLKTRIAAPVTYTATGISFSTLGTITDAAAGFGIFPTTSFRVNVSGSSSNNGIFSITSATTAIMYTSGLVTESSGQTVTIDKFFNNVSIPVVEEILFQKAKLYIDASSTSAGTTIKSNTVLSWEMDYKTGWKGQPAADGRLDFSFTKLAKPSGTLKVTFEHDGTAVAEKAAWRAKTPRLIRLLVQGSTLTTAGTYTYKTLIVDLVGVWKKFGALKDDNGNDTVEGTLMFGYDTTAAQAGQIIVVNQLSALP